MSIKKDRTLIMDRQGEFRIRAYGPNHCGTVEDLLIKYQMICECSTRLDTRGFLFDQINVDNFFQAIRKSQLSCERLVIQSTRKLVKAIRLENPKCEIKRVKLTLSPAPFMARMTYEWAD